MKNTVILKNLLIGGIFATLLVPFIVANGLFFPFITGKAYFFNVLVEILFAIWIILAFADPKYRPKKSCVLWSLGAFMLVMLVANIQGTNPTTSFWSNYERMEGYVTLVHLFAYFLIISSVFTTQKIWDTFFKSLVGVSVIHALYSFAQVAGLTKNALLTERADGTFGNPIYLAGYLLLASFITVYLLFKNKSNYGFYLYPIVLILQVISIFLTATRGSLLAWIGGIFLAFLIYAFLEPSKKYLRISVLSILLAIVLFGSLIFGLKDSAFVQNSLTLRRLSEISVSTGSVKARFVNWGIAWEAVKEKPLLGYGQGGYEYIFDQNYNPEIWDQEKFFDRVHNIIFDWLVAGGFLGLISYLSILFVIGYYLWKKDSVFSNEEKAVLTAMVLGYFVHVFFVFDNLTSYLIMFLIFAYVHHKVSKSIGIFETVNFSKGVITTVIVLIIAGTPFLVWAVNADSYIQNRLLVKGLKISDVENLDDNLNYFKEALNKRTFGEQETLIQLSSLSNRVAESPEPNDSIKKEFYDFTEQELLRYLEKTSYDLKVVSTAGLFYAKNNQIDKSLEMYQKAIEIAPKKQYLYQPVIYMYLLQGKTEEALDTAKISYEINKDNDDAWRVYLEVLISAKNAEGYNALIEDAFSINKPYRVINFSKNLLMKNPANPQNYINLALIYERVGDFDSAIEIMTELSEKFPAQKTQADKFIKELEILKAQQ